MKIKEKFANNTCTVCPVPFRALIINSPATIWTSRAIDPLQQEEAVIIVFESKMAPPQMRSPKMSWKEIFRGWEETKASQTSGVAINMKSSYHVGELSGTGRNSTNNLAVVLSDWAYMLATE